MDGTSLHASAELGPLIEASHIECFGQLGRAAPAASTEVAGIVTLLTGIPHPLFNGVLGARLTAPDLAGPIAAALQPFQARRVPMFWWVGPTTRPADLGSALEAHGLRPLEALSGMAIDLSRLREEPLPAGLAVERVRDTEGLRQWVACTGASFEVVTEAVNAPLLDLLARGGLDIPWCYFLGRQDGRPVAASGLYLSRQSAYVFSVATVPEARRQGFGTAITTAALREGRARGCELGTLFASPMGDPVYRRMGFQEYCRMKLYLWSPEAAPEG